MKQRSFGVILTILSAVFVCESLAATILMPFVGLYVAHLQLIDANDAGYLSGILVSVFQLGQMLTSKTWGSTSDRIGRKPMIQAGLVANAVVAVLFGISPNLPFCIVMRFLHGCANGNVLVAKTVIADITDKQTEGIGFAAICVFWGLGSIIGPAVGGMLYNPAENDTLRRYVKTGNKVVDAAVQAHPALLPCIAIASISVITLVVTSIVLPETSRRAEPPVQMEARNHGVAATPLSVVVVASEEEERVLVEEAPFLIRVPTNSGSGTMGASPAPDYPTVLLPLDKGSGVRALPGRSVGRAPLGLPSGYPPCITGSTDSRSSSKQASFFAVTPSTPSLSSRVPAHPAEVAAEATEEQFGYSDATRLPSTRYVLLLYMCIASTECALLEVIPLWAIADRHKGGLKFSAQMIGWLLGISSVVCVAATVSFPLIVRCPLGTRAIWDFSVMFWAVTSILTPCASYVPQRHRFATTAVFTSLREVGLSWSYSLVYMFVARSAPSKHIGSMNGIAQSVALFSRMVTMLVVPLIFAWSLNAQNHPFPFNFHFSFWLTCVPLLVSYVYSSYLPPRVTDGVEEPDDNS